MKKVLSVLCLMLLIHAISFAAGFHGGYHDLQLLWIQNIQSTVYVFNTLSIMLLWKSLSKEKREFEHEKSLGKKRGISLVT